MFIFLFHPAPISHSLTWDYNAMVIAVYRHMKLTVALPSEKSTMDTSQAGRRFMGVEIEEAFNKTIVKAKFRVQAPKPDRQDKFTNIAWWFQSGTVQIVQCIQTDNSISEPTVEIIPPLVNMAWSTGRTDFELFRQFESMSSRSVVEMYLYDVEHVDDFDIFQFDFNPNRPKHNQSMVKLPIRSFDEATTASKTNTEDTPDQWMKLLMGI